MLCAASALDVWGVRCVRRGARVGHAIKRHIRLGIELGSVRGVEWPERFSESEQVLEQLIAALTLQRVLLETRVLFYRPVGR